ncbi:MAG: DegT/DnrJ/EryC1/StrS aminotransferase family protein, partial [Planctomycetaceae bacterium]
ALDVAFYRPDIDHDVFDACQQSLRDEFRDTAARVRYFETRFAKVVGVEHAVALGSATAGLTIALESIGLGRGDEVLLSALAPPETAAAVIHHGAVPVFIDVAPQTMNADPELLAAAVNDRTRAIITTQHAGLPDQLETISQIAETNRLSLVNYAAYAVSASCHERGIADFGDVTCFGFHSGMEISTGRGGMICTNNRILANRCRLLSGDGGQPDDATVIGDTMITDKDILVAGYDCLLSEMDAVLGLAQLDRLPVAWARRHLLTVDQAR